MHDQTWEERLAEITAKEPTALSEGEIAFLRARRSYLSPAQLGRFAEVLPPEESKSEEDENDVDEDAGKPLEDHSGKELAKVAKQVGLKAKDFESREDLIAAIRQQQQDEEE